ncbi:hypothetical protein PS1_036516 [Malus domestica]
MSTVEFHKILMNQVLPLAWSHNLLTILKLICNFIDRRGDSRKRNQDEVFFTTAVWLYQNHPKTLAYNLVPIFGSFGHILDLPRILSQVLRGEAHLKFTGWMREEADSNGMVKCLKFDIEKFHHHKDHDHHDDYCLQITQAATYLPTIADHCNEGFPARIMPPRRGCAASADDAALLPHDILSYIKYPELEQEANIKWKKMMEVYSKQGKLKNWLATLIKSQDWTADFKKVFDVILEEVVNANLKPDKMVKKVLALTTYKHFLTGSNLSFWGETKMSPFLLLVSATTFTSPKLSFFL